MMSKVLNDDRKRKCWDCMTEKFRQMDLNRWDRGKGVVFFAKPYDLEVIYIEAFLGTINSSKQVKSVFFSRRNNIETVAREKRGKSRSEIKGMAAVIVL